MASMKNNYLFYGILFIVFLVIYWIIGDTLSQPGIDDLEGDYKEISFYRNENNTGPVIRIFAVYTSDTLWHEMKAYGEFMPHTKYGNTKVFFLRDLVEDVAVFPTSPYISAEAVDLCVATYEKSAMGEVNFKKYPFN